MDVDKLKESPIGQLVPISGHDPRSGEEYECLAYVPVHAAVRTTSAARVDIPASAILLGGNTVQPCR